MPRYLVERFIPRAGELTAPELQDIAQQSLRVQRDLKVGIEWIHSTVTGNRMVCLYVADDEAIVREHGRRSGLPIQKISRVSAVFGPMIDDSDQTSDSVGLCSSLAVRIARLEERVYGILQERT